MLQGQRQVEALLILRLQLIQPLHRQLFCSRQRLGGQLQLAIQFPQRLLSCRSQGLGALKGQLQVEALLILRLQLIQAIGRQLFCLRQRRGGQPQSGI